MVRWLLSAVERLGWSRVVLACVAFVGVTAGTTALALGLLGSLALRDFWLGSLATAAALSLLIAMPALAVALRLVDHLAATRQRLEREIERRSLAEVRLRKLVTEDQLTGIPNRRSFLSRARTAMGIARRYRQPLSLLLIDLDHFKQVNDRYGHQVGDRALMRIARILEVHMRESDTPARIGGDEFVVLLPHTSAHDAARAAERIRAAVAAQEEQPHLTVTIGVAQAETSGGQELADLLRNADEALYEAKDSGRNCVSAYPTVSHSGMTRRLMVAG